MLVHHSRLSAWPRSTSDDPYFGPYKILSVDGHRITMRCSPRLGGTLVCAAQHLKRYYDPEDLFREEWELNDEEIAALDLQGAASPMEVEGELPDMMKPVRTPVAIFGSLGVCIYVPASRHWLISYSPIHLT